MRVLVIGKGGREHALLLNLSLSERTERLYAIPGNPGISRLASCHAMDVDDFHELVSFVKQERIDLTITLSNELITEGIADFFEANGLDILAPRTDAAQLEWSKYFAKEFMLRRGIPSSRYAAFNKREYALAYAHSRRLPIVVRIDGLAPENKGVAIVNSYEAAAGAINACFDGKFAKANKCILIEDYMAGHRASVSAICDGENYAIFPTTKNYNRLLDGDKGATVDGIGGIAPHPVFDQTLMERVEKEILQPMLQGMREEGRPYKGFLHLELLIDQQKQLSVIEIACSLKEVEAQVCLPLLECDLLDVLQCANRGDLAYYKGVLPSAEVSATACAISIILNSEGYPEKIADGLPVRFRVGLSLGPSSQLIDQSGDIDHSSCRVLLFHMGSKLDSNRSLITNGGRVFGVTCLARRISIARRSAYKIVEKIDFPGRHYRQDIALGF